jgi:predicted hydrocarbon binding protein
LFTFRFGTVTKLYSNTQAIPKIRIYEMLEKHLIINPEKGEYYDTLYDSPAIILDLFVYRAWHERLYRVFETGASTILFEMGKELGIQSIRKLKEKIKNPVKLATVGMKHGYLWGWGKFSVSKAQLLKMATLGSMTVKVKDCFIPKAMGNTGQASCHLLRGWIVGAFEAMTGKECVCEETKCASKGDAHCEFKIRVMKRMRA